MPHKHEKLNTTALQKAFSHMGNLSYDHQLHIYILGTSLKKSPGCVKYMVYFRFISDLNQIYLRFGSYILEQPDGHFFWLDL